MKRFITSAPLLLCLAAPALSAGTDQETDMQAMTQNVLAGLGIQAPAAEVEAEQPADLGTLVQQALEQGQSDAYLEALVSEAAARGDVEVPDAMVTSEGEVDTKTLLASLVSKSVAKDLEAETQAALIAEANAGAPQPVAEDRTHKVASGESLAGIALAYYGDANTYTKIYEANRDTIQRPDLIRVGQVIRIP